MDVSRRLAVALLAGLAILALVLVLVLQNRAAPSARPVQTTRAGALKVAREFLETAVLQQRLHYAYTLVAPDLKAGMSQRQWETGKVMTYTAYPARNASTARFTVLRSTKKKLYLRMRLLPRPKSGLDACTCFMDMAKQKAGNWLVDSFDALNPYSSPPFRG